MSTAVGRAELGQPDDAAQRGGVDERERDEHAALAEAVDEPPLDRRADPRARREPARHHAGDRERARRWRR